LRQVGENKKMALFMASCIYPEEASRDLARLPSSCILGRCLGLLSVRVPWPPVLWLGLLAPARCFSVCSELHSKPASEDMLPAHVRYGEPECSTGRTAWSPLASPNAVRGEPRWSPLASPNAVRGELQGLSAMPGKSSSFIFVSSVPFALQFSSFIFVSSVPFALQFSISFLHIYFIASLCAGPAIERAEYDARWEVLFKKVDV
jgi:hypothetical protein